MRKHIPTLIALLGLLIASYAFGYQQGTHDMAEHVQSQLEAPVPRRECIRKENSLPSLSDCHTITGE